MQQIKLSSHVGDDGILHLDIPSEFKGVDVKITLTVEALQEEKNKTTETLSEARERLAKVRERFQGQGRQFSDSTKLLREDRDR